MITIRVEFKDGTRFFLQIGSHEKLNELRTLYEPHGVVIEILTDNTKEE